MPQIAEKDESSNNLQYSEPEKSSVSTEQKQSVKSKAAHTYDNVSSSSSVRKKKQLPKVESCSSSSRSHDKKKTDST